MDNEIKEAQKKLKTKGSKLMLLATPQQIKSNSSYIFITTQGDINTNNIQDVCFARLHNNNGILSASILPMQYKRERINKKKLYSWFNWIINKSPWSNAFVTKSVKEGITSGFILDTSYHKSYVVGAATALREGWEFEHTIPDWLYWKRKGISSARAHVLTTLLHAKARELPNVNGNHRSIPEYSIEADNILIYEDKEKFLAQIKDLPPMQQPTKQSYPEIWTSLFPKFRKKQPLYEVIKYHCGKVEVMRTYWGDKYDKVTLTKQSILQVPKVLNDYCTNN